jgi:uncharacterized protein YjaZ
MNAGGVSTKRSLIIGAELFGKTPERPADLGYYVGYKICQEYYEKSADKKKAIKDILEIRDFDQFFRESGYGQTVAAGE